VVDHPALLSDVELLVDGFIPFHYLPQAGEVLHRVFIAPTGLGDQPLRLAPHRTAIEWRCPFADRARLHHVIAEELKLVPQAFFQFRQLRVVLILQKIHLQANDGPAFAVEREPGIVHAVLIEIGQNLIGMEGSRCRKQYLIQMRGQSDAHRVSHRIERAASLVLERLHAAEQEESRGRWTASRESRGGEGAVCGNIHLLNIRMQRRRSVDCIEESFAQAVGDSGTGKAFV
jgi:hypothetical protein